MAQTISEREFERFCRARRIPFERVPETDSRTPDYEIVLGTSRVVVEVKEMERNDEERESDRLVAERGYGNVISHTPGERVRRKIQSCSKQLKARAKGTLPSLLVVFDGGRVVGHVEPYNIRVAMYGLEQVHIAVPPIGTGSPHATGIGHGPKRKMTATDNTSISAIGALVMTGPDQHHLLIYRNSFAKIPLDATLLSRFGVRHFDIGDSSTGAASDWIEIPLTSR